MALRDLSSTQLLVFWLVWFLAAVLGFRLVGNVFFGSSQTGNGGLVGVSLPMLLSGAVLISFAILIVVTIVWFRSRGGAGT